MFRRRIVHGASEDRLQQLIEARVRAGADRESNDARIRDLFGEEWCIMVTDLADFSRRVAELGIIHFLQTISESERILARCSRRPGGTTKNPRPRITCRRVSVSGFGRGRVQSEE